MIIPPQMEQTLGLTTSDEQVTQILKPPADDSFDNRDRVSATSAQKFWPFQTNKQKEEGEAENYF